MRKTGGIDLIEAKFLDMGGVLRGRLFPSNRLQNLVRNGFGFDGSSVGFVGIQDSDMVAIPDVSTKRILPCNDGRILLFICDILQRGKPFDGSTRFLLRKELKELPYKVLMGPEIEFYALRSGNQVDTATYMASYPQDTFEPFKRKLLPKLQELGLEIEFAHHEVGPGQHEIILQSDNPTEMADKIVLYKYILRVLAREDGFDVTFMPKPFPQYAGNGMHVHMSLWDKENIFYDHDGGNKISQKGRYFIGGLLEFYSEIALATNSTVNSYKRLVPGHEAPVYITWGVGNRSTLIRIPNYSTEKQRLRVEVRTPDSLSDPYLAFLSIIRAGMEGIKKKIEPPEPCETNVYNLPLSKIKKSGVRTLPKNLLEAIRQARDGRILKEILGKHFERFIGLKENEWDEYSKYSKKNGGKPSAISVAKWEWDRYFFT